jgi:hypothetical protein
MRVTERANRSFAEIISLSFTMTDLGKQAVFGGATRGDERQQQTRELTFSMTGSERV